jgi:MinD superfamily P-loop ATPase
MKIVIASGKGGTGKSMLASSLSVLFSDFKKIVACDCDVDAPNLGLWLGVTEYDDKEIITVSEKAIIDYERCIDCGKCQDTCRFGAIEKREKFNINKLTCEGCGVCKLVCPTKAIELKPVKNGLIRVKKTDWSFPLVSGQIYPGETGSGKIVQRLRKKAEKYDHDLMMIDSAAGIGCPVIASITGCDYAVLVTEPTPSGFTDLGRVIEIINHFQIPYGVVINKWDINPQLSKEIENWSSKHLLGKISYDRIVINSIVNLKPVIASRSRVVDEIKNIFETIKSFKFR